MKAEKNKTELEALSVLTTDNGSSNKNVLQFIIYMCSYIV